VRITDTGRVDRMTAAIEVRVCANPNCGKPLVRNAAESSSNYNRRRFCSIACTNRPGVTARGNRPLDVGPRTCASPGCGARLERRDGENSADWKTRRYCSAQCYRPRKNPGATHPVLPARRWCGSPGCGLELKRRHGECAADFRKRRFCTRDCSNRAAGKPQPAAGTVVLREDRTDWSKAKCASQDDVAWWTDTGRDEDEEERLRDLAHRYCAPCPLRKVCEERGRAERFGLFGGVLWRVVGGRAVALDLLAPPERIEVAS
jgi:hypothetical protein